MLYLIGGVPRSGKSILARQILSQHRIPYFATDLLMKGLVNGMPDLGLNLSDTTLVRAPRMWPILRSIAAALIENAEDYVIEGDVLMPAHAAELAQRFSGMLRCCFLGYEDAKDQEKMAAIRSHATAHPDWTIDCDDAHLLRLVGEFKELSARLRKEAERYGLAYFDTSSGRDVVLRDALEYLMS